MRLTLAALLLAVVGFTACQNASTHPRFLPDRDRRHHLTLIAEEYTSSVRWGRHDLALGHVHPEMRNAWRETFSAGRRITFTGADILSVDLAAEPTRVDVSVIYQLYRTPNLTEQRVEEHQVWTYDVEAERWFVAPDLDVFEDRRS